MTVDCAILPLAPWERERVALDLRSPAPKAWAGEGRLFPRTTRPALPVHGVECSKKRYDPNASFSDIWHLSSEPRSMGSFRRIPQVHPGRRRQVPGRARGSAGMTAEPPMQGVVLPQRGNRVPTRLDPNPEARCMGLFRWRESPAPVHGVVPPKKASARMPRSNLIPLILSMSKGWHLSSDFRAPVHGVVSPFFPPSLPGLTRQPRRTLFSRAQRVSQSSFGWFLCALCASVVNPLFVILFLPQPPHYVPA